MLCGTQDLSSPTRDGTHASFSGNTEPSGTTGPPGKSFGGHSLTMIDEHEIFSKISAHFNMSPFTFLF